ncbi:yeats family-domain-containing protein [Phycomyces blakesleeanus]
MASSIPEASHYTRRTAAAAMYIPPVPLPKKKISKPVHRYSLFGRRSDGLYVRLSCPACKRDDFANQQGFLNHCRLAHGLEFGPYEQIMLRCGKVVDESEVPFDHPARMRPVTKPVPLSTQGSSVKKERPTIKVFEEDVDLELDHEGNAPHQNDTQPLNPETLSSTEQPTDNVVESRRNSQSDNQTPDKSINEQDDEPDIHNNKRSPSPERRSFESSKCLPETEKQEKDEKKIDEKGRDNKQKEEEQVGQVGQVGQIVAPVESFAAAHEGGSRFYIKRRIIVGNVSKFIIPEKRDPTLKHFTHKWMIYVVEPPQAQEVAAFITGVRFHLHPSYKPHDVVDVNEPPFRLTRLGWGEFPIRIQLHFVDKRRNKIIDVIHHLKLDDVHSGKQVLGSERGIDIELDRNTDFKDIEIPSKPLVESATVHQNTLPKESGIQEAHPLVTTGSKQRLSLLHGILKESVRRLPIIRAGSQGVALPYTCAPSLRAYFNWSVGKRKALEWHRAHLLRIQVQQKAFETMDTVLRVAATSLSTKDVIGWCKDNRHTPKKSEMSDTTPAYEGMGICKFCGCLRELHGQDDDRNVNAEEACPRRPPGWSMRKRASGLSSVTSVSHLLNQLEPGWDIVKEAEDMDIDVDTSATQKTHEVLLDDTERRPSPERTLLENAREVGTHERMNVANERYVDWIWSVVNQLRLKTVVANDIALARDGSLQGPTPSFDLNGAIDQRLEVGNIMAQATRVFLKRLLGASMDVWKRERDTDPGEKLLVPHHVYQATQNVDTFDFLTNRYMGPFEKDRDST